MEQIAIRLRSAITLLLNALLKGVSISGEVLKGNNEIQKEATSRKMKK